MEKIDNVSVATLANVYFDGKCVSHTVFTGDGSRKTIGIVLPASLTFTTKAPEIMDIIAGTCRVRLPGQDWQAYTGGSSFNVPANASFDIEVSETVHYVCHFG